VHKVVDGQDHAEITLYAPREFYHQQGIQTHRIQGLMHIELVWTTLRQPGYMVLEIGQNAW
jgi:hypothetical protein